MCDTRFLRPGARRRLLGGSWVVISGVRGRVTIVITYRL